MPDDIGMRWAPLAPCPCLLIVRLPELGFLELCTAVRPAIDADQPRRFTLRTEEIEGDDDTLVAVRLVNEHPLFVLPGVAVCGICRLFHVLFGGCGVLTTWRAARVACFVHFDARVKVLAYPLIHDFTSV